MLGVQDVAQMISTAIPVRPLRSQDISLHGVLKAHDFEKSQFEGIGCRDWGLGFLATKLQTSKL